MAWNSFEELRKRFGARQDAYAHVNKMQLDAYLVQLDEMIQDGDRREATKNYLAQRRYRQARRIVLMAMEMLGTPHAEVNVITDSQQITIAGDAGPHKNPVGEGWCRNVVGLADTLAVSDGASHPMVVATPAAQDSGITSYLGTPIRANGYPVGALCVFDEEPRRWTETDAERLEMLAGILSDSTPGTTGSTPTVEPA